MQGVSHPCRSLSLLLPPLQVQEGVAQETADQAFERLLYLTRKRLEKKLAVA